MRHLLHAFLVLAALGPRVFAHNNYFLPGDAFFSVAVPQSDIMNWTASDADTLELSYSRFDGEFFACGNIGYTNLIVTGVSPGFRRALAEAYWRFSNGHRPLYREEGNDGKSSLEQTNSVVALIYGKDFNLNLPLGLKFNEDWITQGAGRYCGLYTTAKAVEIDWRQAAGVAPLPIVEKPAPTAHLASSYEVADTINSPLHIKSEDMIIVLAGFADQKAYSVTQRCPDLQSIMESEDGSRYMVITNTQIRDFNCDENGKWTEETISLPVPAQDSWIPKKPTTPAVK